VAPDNVAPVRAPFSPFLDHPLRLSCHEVEQWIALHVHEAVRLEQGFDLVPAGRRGMGAGRRPPHTRRSCGHSPTTLARRPRRTVRRVTSLPSEDSGSTTRPNLRRDAELTSGAEPPRGL